MGRALSIKDTETYDIVAKLAEMTGLSMTQAVKKAATAQLEQIEVERLEKLRVWVELMKANPLPDGFEFERDTALYELRDGWDK
jgi:hypothetical protein